MCCLNLSLDTLLINSLNTCRNQSFSLEDLKKIAIYLGNSENRYVVCNLNDENLNKIVSKYSSLFYFLSEKDVALQEFQRDKILPLGFFNFGYSQKTIESINKIAYKFKKE